MAIACFRLVTSFPEPPLFSVPCFRSSIARSTFSEAFLPYLAMDPPCPHVRLMDVFARVPTDSGRDRQHLVLRHLRQLLVGGGLLIERFLQQIRDLVMPEPLRDRA